MVATPVSAHERRKWDRASGVPGPHELGASRKEALWALGAMIVFALIIASFWFEATR